MDSIKRMLRSRENKYRKLCVFLILLLMCNSCLFLALQGEDWFFHVTFTQVLVDCIVILA